MVKQDAATGPIPSEIRQQIEAHLSDLLASAAFRGSRRSQEFLRYIVEETLAGRGAGIKERNIAVDVFGKGSEFDAQSDSLVRVKAAEVRKRLAQAYASEMNGPVRVELPIGSYRPVLSFPLEHPMAVRHEVEEAVEPAKVPLGRNHRFIVYFVAALAAVAAVLIPGYQLSRTEVDSFWSSFAKGDKPVLLSLPTPKVAMWNDRVSEIAKSGAVSDSLFKEGTFVGVGAAEGAARFGEQLAIRHRPFFLKFGADVSFSDLRQYPAILLGASTSRWTMELTRSLPLQFKDGKEFAIVEVAEPKHVWQAENAPNERPRIGYALVSRLLKPDSGNPLLMVAGIDAHDTQSAVEFLTREEYFGQFAKRAKNWKTANFQFLIRTSIHGHTPSSPELVSYKTW